MSGRVHTLADLAQVTRVPLELVQTLAFNNRWPEYADVVAIHRDEALHAIREAQKSAFRGTLWRLAKAADRGLDRVERAERLLTEHLFRDEDFAKVADMPPDYKADLANKMTRANQTLTQSLTQITGMLDTVLGISEAHKAARAAAKPKKGERVGIDYAALAGDEG
jgi:hypothetical protein